MIFTRRYLLPVQRKRNGAAQCRVDPKHLLFSLLLLGWLFSTSALATDDPPLDASLNERVLSVPGDPANPVMLQVTTFTPNGTGPFPLAILNHGKDLGLPKNQPRYRPAYIGRYFLSRGYVVACPMLRGFAGSGGTLNPRGCDVEELGLVDAADITAVIRYMAHQPNIDPDRIIVSGQSFGGWNTLAFGTRGFPGVKGLLNFAGGVKEPKCAYWEAALVEAAQDYGAKTRLPSLWFYGDNDQTFSVKTWRRMFDLYTKAGGNAELVAFGTFISDAHNMLGTPEGLAIWMPKVDAFLQRIGLPSTEINSDYLPKPFPPPTNFAAINDVNAIPNATDKTKALYQIFLTKPCPRIFVITPNGECASFFGGYDPIGSAADTLSKLHTEFRIYAVDNDVVWKPTTPIPPATAFALVDDIKAVPYLNAAGRQGYAKFLTLPMPRAFVIAPDGGWAFSARGFDPQAKAIENIGANHPGAKVYAVNDWVVWKEDPHPQ